MTTKSAPALDTAERRESDNVIPSMPGWIAPAKHEPTNLHAIQRAREAEFDAVVGTLSIGPRYRELKAEDDRFLARQREIGAWQAEPGYSKRRKAAHDTDLRAAAEAVRRGRPDPGWPTREAVDTEDQELREEKERIGVMREAVARDLEALAAGEGLALELEGRIASRTHAPVLAARAVRGELVRADVARDGRDVAPDRQAAAAGDAEGWRRPPRHRPR
jgi:hypothetical protein